MAPISTWLPVTLASIGTALALIAFSYQVHRARFNQSVDFLFRLEADFFGPAKVKQRSLAATNMLHDAQNLAEMEDVLDFFETLAMLTKKGALNLYMVWHTLNYWIERYYAVALPHIRSCQKSDPSRWEDLDWIIPKIQNLSKKRTAQSRKMSASAGTTGAISPEEMLRFLNEEAAEN